MYSTLASEERGREEGEEQGQVQEEKEEQEDYYENAKEWPVAYSRRTLQEIPPPYSTLPSQPS